MAVVKNRLLLMLYLLDNSDQPLQARQLAAMAGVSERTVKNDMAELRELAQASGVEILTRKGKGYLLQVLDHAVYDPVREQLQIRFSTMNYTKSEIVGPHQRYCPPADRRTRYLTFDAISDQLFLSRRTLQAQLRKSANVWKRSGWRCSPGRSTASRSPARNFSAGCACLNCMKSIIIKRFRF